MQSVWSSNDIKNLTEWQERLIQSQRGQTKGVVLKSLDKQTAYNQVESFDYSTDYAHSVCIVVDANFGEVYLTIIQADNTVQKVRVLWSDLNFDENFGDIKSLTISATAPYRAIIRR